MGRRTETGDEKLKESLQSFSDLVFGFSLSLLAIRLDVPARVEDTFEPTRWLAVMVTFFLICRFWLEQHRIFRHRFAVKRFDMVMTFIFLFAIAILPYAVQTFLRFQIHLVSFTLYLGDLIFVLLSLSILRVRGLTQRRHDESDVAERLGDWRRSVALITGASLAGCVLLFLHRPGADFQNDVRAFLSYAVPGIAVIVLLVRSAVRRLPAFLR